MSDDPPRRWHQFSLKTLLIVMTVAIVIFGGWVQYMRNRAQENRDRVAAVEKATKKAVAAIEELDGTVTSEYNELRRQTWLEEQFDDPGGADDPVGGLEVTEVNFWGSQFTNAGLRYVKGLTKLKSLVAGNSGPTDAGLEHVKGMTNLQELHIRYTKVTDAGLEHLKGLKSLSFLDLRSTSVTNEGVKKLRQALPNCKIWLSPPPPPDPLPFPPR